MTFLYIPSFLILMIMPLISEGSVWPCDEDFKILDKELDGDILLSGDEEFDDTKVPWPNIWPGTYIAVARPQSEDDLVKLIDYAREWNLPVSLYSTGFDLKGRSTGYGRDTFQISLHKMKDMSVIMNDPENNNEATLTTQTGNTFLEIYEYVSGYGKFVVGPTCVHSGPGGWYLGGGSSIFTSHLGLGVDQIIMVRVVTANGEILEVRENGVTKVNIDGSTESIESDLWWALTGGGGGIGVIVSSYKVKLYDDPGLVSYTAQYPIRTNTADNLFGEEVLNEFSTFMLGLPYKWGGQIILVNLLSELTPEQATDWPEGTILNGTVTVNMVYFGTWSDALEGYEILQSIKPEWALYQTPTNYTNHYEYYLAEGFAFGAMQSYLGGTLLQDEDFNVTEGEDYTNYAGTADNMLDNSLFTWCTLNIVGGNAKTFNQTKNSVSENYRNARASLYCALEWENPEKDRELDEENMAVAQNWFNYTLYPIGKGKYLNKAEQTLLMDWRTEFWGPIENYDRLLAVKSEVDPENLLGCIQCVGDDTMDLYHPEDQECSGNKTNMSIMSIFMAVILYLLNH